MGNKYGLTPLNNRVVITPIDVNVTDSGIILQDSSKVQYGKGEVVAVAKTISDVKVGDIIYFNRHSAGDFEHQGIKLKILNLMDVLGVEN